MVEAKVNELLKLFQGKSTGAEVCELLYCFTLDVSSAFIFTRRLGTEALRGNQSHRALLRGLGRWDLLQCPCTGSIAGENCLLLRPSTQRNL